MNNLSIMIAIFIYYLNFEHQDIKYVIYQMHKPMIRLWMNQVISEQTLKVHPEYKTLLCHGTK